MNETKVIYRPWTENDFEQVIEILLESWDKAYASFIPKEDLALYLSQTYNKDKLKELFNNPDVFCFTAEVDKKAVGWLKLLINKEENRFYLASIYVLPEFQGLKIGRQLMNIAFHSAKQKGFSEIWIGVMNNNSNALRWYEKTGFEFLENLPFTMGNTTVNHLIGVKKNL